jgi:hypothetical protein
MVLALEGRYESYTLGRDISIEQVQTIEALGAKHGFELGGFRSFERPVTDSEIERVCSAALHHRRFAPGFAYSPGVARARVAGRTPEPADVRARVA